MKRNEIEIHTFTAPSYWASFLINGDASGLGDDEADMAALWARKIATFKPGYRGYVVGAAECGFMRCHDAREFALVADCCEYIFHFQPVTK